MLGVYSLSLLILSVVGFSQNIPKLSRDDFPPGFIFGAGTSSYQVEGAVAEDGRSPSIWDSYTHAGKMPDKSTGDVSVDQYHKYKEDVKLMSDVGIDAYRFSISWSRLIPNGRGAVNPKGVQYYGNLIDELISRGIQPHVTLCHLDLPQILEDEYGGWLSPKMVEDFTAYADVCFREFGDRVAHWTTANEPNIMGIAAYDNGIFAPSRCSYPFGVINCTRGNSSVEPYIAVHHTLLAHASVAKLYREKYQAKQKGWIGINVYGFWCIPFTNSTEDVEAAQRSLDFMNGWIVHPLVYGDYPEVMKKNAGSRIPSFTKLESERVKGSADFLGVNHYITTYVENDPDGPNRIVRDFNADMFAKFRVSKDEKPSGQVSPFNLTANPSGLQNLLEYLKNDYGNPPVYVQENGETFLKVVAWAQKRPIYLSKILTAYTTSSGLGAPYDETLNDTARVEYLSGYLNATLSAIRNGSNAKGYFVWAFLDVFEFVAGYQARYGLYHVDFEDVGLTRRPKFSAYWYSNLLKKGKEMNLGWATQQTMAHTIK